MFTFTRVANEFTHRQRHWLLHRVHRSMLHVLVATVLSQAPPSPMSQAPPSPMSPGAVEVCENQCRCCSNSNCQGGIIMTGLPSNGVCEDTNHGGGCCVDNNCVIQGTLDCPFGYDLSLIHI